MIPSLGEILYRFFHDPIVYPLYLLIVMALANLAYAIYSSVVEGTFTWAKLPGFGKTLVLEKVFPSVILGVVVKATGSVPEGAVSVLAYASLVTAQLAAETAQFADNFITKKTAKLRATPIDGPTM